jgi:hypothetical protein
MHLAALGDDVAVIITSGEMRIFRYLATASGNVATQNRRAVGRLPRGRDAIVRSMNQILRIGRGPINASCIGSIVEPRHWSI